MKLITVFLYFLLTIQSKAQTLDVFDEIMTSKIESEVKQLGQFFRRFNMEDTVFLRVNIKPTRFTNILSLFNSRNENFLNDSSVIKFINDAISCNKKPGYTDSNWYAVAHANFTMSGKKVTVPVYLRFTKHSGQGYSWIIDKIDPSQLNISFTRNEQAFIDPVNNELNFLELAKTFDKKQSLISYTARSYKPDYLSVFMYMAQKGLITFNQIDNVSYHFNTIPGWKFTVNYFNRIDNNSGWLISEIKHTGIKNNSNKK